jgi:hypothetical protein
VQSIDIFNLATLEIFRKCLSNFPLPVELDPSEISNVVEGYFSSPVEAEALFSHLTDIKDKTGGTINWLKDEGFLKVVHEPLSRPITATLTQKGVSASNAYIPALGEGKRFSDFMSTGVKDITKNVVSTLVAGLLANGS